MDTMDIYAPEGTKVRFTGKNGHDIELEFAKSRLEVGKIYTVHYTDVGGWHTDVVLKEVPDASFNSVHFEEV